MNCDEEDASRVTRPPRTEPVPSTTIGSVPRPPSSNATPRVRRASSTGPIGRTRACGSPSNSTRPYARAAAGGRNRMTVPASPTSTWTPPRRVSGGRTTQSATAETSWTGIPAPWCPSAGTSSISTPSARGPLGDLRLAGRGLQGDLGLALAPVGEVLGAPGQPWLARGVDGGQEHATHHRHVLEELDPLCPARGGVLLLPERVASQRG